MVTRESSRGWVALLAMTAVAAGCADGDRPETTFADSWSDPFCAQVMPRVAAWYEEAARSHPRPDDDRYGGTVVVGGIGELGSSGLNAFATDDAAARGHQQFVGLMTLIRYDERIEPVPYLAERVEVSDDETMVTFHLRRDVTWHDGEPTDAHDVAFTFRSLLDPELGFANPQFFTHWKSGGEAVEVLDDFTVRVHMRRHSGFLDPFAVVGIMPEHLLGSVPVDQLTTHPYGTQCPVGNGPFVFQSHEVNRQWSFLANPAFPESLGGRPYLDRYVFRRIEEQATLLTELLTEGIDVFVRVRPDQVPAIEAAEHLRLINAPSRNYNFVAWNTRLPQLADARVRRALAMGWDRDGFVRANLGEYARVANGPVPPFHWAYDPAWENTLSYDPEAAGRLLDEAGWIDRDGDGVRENRNGLPLRITVSYNAGAQLRQTATELMQAQLAEIGVEIVPEAADYRALVAAAADPEVRGFEGLLLAWTVEFRLDDTGIFHSGYRDAPFALTGTNNPVLDSLLERLSATTDREEALPLWRAYQEAVAEEQPYQFLYYPQTLIGINRRIQGATPDARGEWVDIRHWYIDPEAN